MARRLLLYIKEMFPLQIYLPYTLISFYGLFLITQALFQSEQLIVNTISVLGCLTLFSITLLMRVYDEFKDYETDKILFPNRAVARGAVKLSDLRFLGITLLITMVLLNINMGWVLFPFVLMLVFSLLTYKWFFLKEIIQNNLILAFITHQPLLVFVNAYIIATALFTLGIKDVNLNIVIAGLIYFLPITAWETSRKIRAIGKETAYVTYSKLFGPKMATLLPLTSLLITGILSIILGINLKFQTWYMFSITSLMLVYLIICIRFMITPSESNNVIKPYTEAIGTLTLSLILFQIILKYDVSFQF